MRPMSEAYITGVGAYLPGDPIDNEQLTDRCATSTYGPMSYADGRTSNILAYWLLD